ncbi:MAG: endonuclease/exonuclease/phosphatase family protein [Clostridia bacterium]|nr:endonuclease/exonuclease/phosphatase family protein [Clostridia bacterium]
MKIATWNISAGINTSDYSGEFFDKPQEASVDDKCLNEIAKAIVENDIDVIALQEVVTTISFKYLKMLSKKTNLKYFESFENSPCHLIKNANFGVAILSKYPIKNITKQFFKNPNLTKQTNKGLYHSHDKGYLAVRVLTKQPFWFLSASLLPFHRFDCNILNFKNLFSEFQDFVIDNNVFAMGDYNAIEGKDSLQKVFDKLKNTHNFLFDQITTTDNKKCDNILLPKNIVVKNKYIVERRDVSDHYLCVAEVDL